jgi:hypothetical protein
MKLITSNAVVRTLIRVLPEEPNCLIFNTLGLTASASVLPLRARRKFYWRTTSRFAILLAILRFANREVSNREQPSRFSPHSAFSPYGFSVSLVNRGVWLPIDPEPRASSSQRRPMKTSRARSQHANPSCGSWLSRNDAEGVGADRHPAGAAHGGRTARSRCLQYERLRRPR